MRSTKSLISENAKEIERLRAEIHGAVATRSNSAELRRKWSNACSEFHDQYPKLFFPGGVEIWAAMMRRDASALDTGIDFLEADPKFFRSGYMKEYLWGRLKGAELSIVQVERLEAVALGWLSTERPNREFWAMASFLRIRGSELVWARVLQLAETPLITGSTKATWLLASRRNVDVIGWLRDELWRLRGKPWDVANIRYPL